MGIPKESVLRQTESLCPECLTEIQAVVIERDGKVYLQKTCQRHGYFEALHPWSNPRHYQGIMQIQNTLYPNAANGLVINVNFHCNQMCPFCFARANEFDMHEPDIREIMRTVTNFRGEIIYLSGGEPTLRRDIFEIIRHIKHLRYKVILFSNGKKLVDNHFVYELKRNGVDLVILQFDTFDDTQYVVLRGEKLSAIKLEAIENLRQARIPVYLFAMIVSNVNEDQVSHLLAFAARNNDCIKLINFNPVWTVGRYQEYPPMDASAILDKILNVTSFTIQDFFDSGLFSRYLLGIYHHFKENNGNHYPRCEMRCYAAVIDNALVPLSRLFDIRKINGRLQKIYDSLYGGRNWDVFKGIIFLIYELVVEFSKRKEFRSFMLRTVKLCCTRRGGIARTKILSIIVGTFHTAANIDFDFVKTCNLYSDYPSNTTDITSSCIRQITIMKTLNSAKAV